MRTIAAMIAGLLLSTVTFFAGLIIALTYLNAGEPDHQLNGRNTATLWTGEPVAVDKTSQSFERLPARPKPKTQAVAARNKAGTGGKAIMSTAPTTHAATDTQSIDPMTTGAIEAKAPLADDARDTWRTTSHMQWCSNRYRSYRADDNSYRPYGGARRPCQSPYFNVATADFSADAAANSNDLRAADEDRQRIEEASPETEQASYQEMPSDYADSNHIQSCLERYRSYRPEDNSYQPFDGGPRRQCQ
jgi:hypothetical protein